MKIGPFFIDTKELFLIALVIILLFMHFTALPLLWFQVDNLLVLAVLFLFIKGLLPAIHNEAFLILALFTIFLTLYWPFFQVLLFFGLSFIFFRLLKVI